MSVPAAGGTPAAVPGARGTLALVPTTLGEARRFVAEVHRHLPAVTGGLYAAGVALEGERVGVAVIGRPVAPASDDGWTLEVSRVAVREGVPNACSKLYGAARGVARDLGYARLQTYTLASEPGTSLRAAGFVPVATVRAKRWPTGGGLMVEKTRWEIRFARALGDGFEDPTRAAVLKLSREEGLTVRRIARVLGISKSRVGRILREARPASGDVRITETQAGRAEGRGAGTSPLDASAAPRRSSSGDGPGGEAG